MSSSSMSSLENFLKTEFGGLLDTIEPVSRLLPIGFRKEKTFLAKIFLTNPSKVSLVRDELRKKDFVKEVYEADIPFKYRFMADYGISGMETVKVTGKGARTNTVKTSHRIEVEKVEPAEEITVPIKHMALDIETASQNEGLPDARRDEITMISLAFSPEFNENSRYDD